MTPGEPQREKPQRESYPHPEEPPWQIEGSPDEQSAAWRLAWALVGVLAFLVTMYGLNLA
jgi:hypothetical protein